MLIGIPKEIKDHEFRVGVSPTGVRALALAGHRVMVEQSAGLAVGFDDADYRAAGANVVRSASKVYTAELVIKVKEPQPSEFDLLRKGQILFTYLHLAAERPLVAALLKRRVTAVAYETVRDANGMLALLTPMSEVAGRIAVQAGAASLEMINGGNGTLLGGVPGVLPAHVVIVGGGVAGTHAAQMALGMGARVSILDISLKRLRELDMHFAGRVATLYSERAALETLLGEADLAVGAVLIPGRSAPKLITRNMVRSMRRGSALVDIAIDQGGCAETSRPTTHSAPRYIELGVVHYCVTNMPAACARTATQALTHATLPYALTLARYGQGAFDLDAGLREGLNTYDGNIVLAGLEQDLAA